MSDNNNTPPLRRSGRDDNNSLTRSSTGAGDQQAQAQTRVQETSYSQPTNITNTINAMNDINLKSSAEVSEQMSGYLKEIQDALGDIDEKNLKMTVFNLISLAYKSSKCGSLMNSCELKYTNLRCIHDGSACGDIQGGRPTLIYGIYCQKHLRKLINTDIILTEMDNKIIVTPVACSKTTDVTIGHPILSLISNSTEANSRQLLSRLPNQIDGIDPIIKFITKASKIVTSNNLFDSSEISRALIHFNKEYATNFANYLECSKDNVIIWDFSLKYSKANKEMKVIRDITKLKPISKMNTEESDNPIYRYYVPVTYLIKEDRLTLGQFIPSIRADNNFNIVESHIPNCQLFNGLIVEGIGPTLPHGSPMVDRSKLLNFNYSPNVNDKLKTISVIRSYSPKILHCIQYGDYPPPIEAFKKSLNNNMVVNIGTTNDQKFALNFTTDDTSDDDDDESIIDDVSEVEEEK
ncbi:hypothetical protein KQX54_001781 [Cotesia glomerata]|uniref:Uncharacterized protein n=1 Tax=Cotesia glomerata TaxID=32391 RepID=A0AAV7HU17_COTGL|nr:hypothetical protein KQX54_001781 [Cotesia glomerata]